MTGRPRGRPQAFSRDAVLDLAINEFRRSGYDGATMDKLAQSMGITKPSIYRAFGDRKSLYREAIKKYGASISNYWRTNSEQLKTLEEFVNRFVEDAVSWFTMDMDGQRGCLMLSTMSHAAADKELMGDLCWLISSMEDEVTEYISQRYLTNGSRDQRAREIALLLTSFAHSLATRARAGVSEDKLRADAKVMAKAALSIT